MNDDIPSAIGGSPSGNTAASKAKGPTPFQQKKNVTKTKYHRDYYWYKSI